MLILFDQATPVPLKHFLKGHLVRTAAQEGWARLRNGDLLHAAEEAGFDLLVTTDKNLHHQQNLADRRIAVMILGCQQWPELRLHVQRVVDAVQQVLPGSCIEVEVPST